MSSPLDHPRSIHAQNGLRFWNERRRMSKWICDGYCDNDDGDDDTLFEDEDGDDDQGVWMEMHGQVQVQNADDDTTPAGVVVGGKRKRRGPRLECSRGGCRGEPSNTERQTRPLEVFVEGADDAVVADPGAIATTGPAKLSNASRTEEERCLHPPHRGRTRTRSTSSPNRPSRFRLHHDVSESTLVMKRMSSSGYLLELGEAGEKGFVTKRQLSDRHVEEMERVEREAVETARRARCAGYPFPVMGLDGSGGRAFGNERGAEGFRQKCSGEQGRGGLRPRGWSIGTISELDLDATLEEMDRLVLEMEGVEVQA